MSENSNWSITVDVSDVSAPSNKPRRAPEGYYKGEIVKSYIEAERNPNKVQFHVRITDGAFAGAMCFDSMMLPNSTERDNRKYWRGLMESIGLSAPQLNAQKQGVNLSGEALVGRETTIYWKPGDRDAGTWNRILFLAPEDWKQEKASFESKSAPTVNGAAATTTVSATPTPTPAAVPPQPSAGFAPNVSSSDLLSMLNN
jgi:hypothetical protein